MKRGWAVLLLLFLAGPAFADGGVYIHKTAFATDVSIPDQRALLCWSNGVERLAIDTRFVAAGTNFAWVVPLPNPPVIEEATTGLFATLEYLFRPAVIHDVTPFYSFLLFCVGLTYLALTVRRNTPPRISDTLVSLGTALALLPATPFIAVFLVVLLPYAVWRVRIGRESWLAVLVAFLVATFLGAMFLPALSKAGATAAGTAVSILDRQTVGVYETTTITGKDPRALADWLNDNGYSIPPAANRVVSNYVKRGWVFVAAKLHRDAAGRAAGSPHPLCFTFSSDRAVYPMQLTGVENSNLVVDLFVFGPLRAQAKNFHVERCDSLIPLQRPDRYTFREPAIGIPVEHPLIRQWSPGTQVATRLSATLTPAMMAEDVEVEWTPFTREQQRFYSNSGAATLGFNWGVAFFTGILLLASIAAAVSPRWQSQLKRIAGTGAIVGLLVAAIIFFAIDKTAVRLVHSPRMRTIQNVRVLGYFFAAEAGSNFLSVAEARALIKSLPEKDKDKVLFGHRTLENLLLGGSIREEDSPGNYVLRPSGNDVEFIWFDADGAEHGLER